jgi:hypothetical protein
VAPAFYRVPPVVHQNVGALDITVKEVTLVTVGQALWFITEYSSRRDIQDKYYSCEPRSPGGGVGGFQPMPGEGQICMRRGRVKEERK